MVTGTWKACRARDEVDGGCLDDHGEHLSNTQIEVQRRLSRDQSNDGRATVNHDSDENTFGSEGNDSTLQVIAGTVLAGRALFPE